MLTGALRPRDGSTDRIALTPVVLMEGQQLADALFVGLDGPVDHAVLLCGLSDDLFQRCHHSCDTLKQGHEQLTMPWFQHRDHAMVAHGCQHPLYQPRNWDRCVHGRRGSCQIQGRFRLQDAL